MLLPCTTGQEDKIMTEARFKPVWVDNRPCPEWTILDTKSGHEFSGGYKSEENAQDHCDQLHRVSKTLITRAQSCKI